MQIVATFKCTEVKEVSSYLKINEMLSKGHKERTQEKPGHLIRPDWSHHRALWEYSEREEREVKTWVEKKDISSRNYSKTGIFLPLKPEEEWKNEQKYSHTVCFWESVIWESHLIDHISSVNKEQYLCKEHFLCE